LLIAHLLDRVRVQLSMHLYIGAFQLFRFFFDLVLGTSEMHDKYSHYIYI
jgi:hypothetical protein